MRNLILAVAMAFGPVCGARTNNPELIDWPEFAAMTAAHQEQYLSEVAAALADFEVHSGQVFAADTFGSYPYFRELFVDVLDSVLPEAHADVGDGVNCGDVSFRPETNAGWVCVDAKGMSSCSHQGQAGTEIVAAYKRKCHDKFYATPNVAETYARTAQPTNNLAPNSMNAQNTTGGMPAELRDRPAARPANLAPNGTAAAQTAGVGGLPAQINPNKPPATTGSLSTPKGCEGVSGAKRYARPTATARKATTARSGPKNPRRV